MDKKLEKLITEIKDQQSKHALSDEYLKEHNHMTRDEVGIGEFSYGIVMVPVDWVLPYLEAYREKLNSEENKE